MAQQGLAVAVIADDLSGGADSGASFGRAGLDVAIQLDSAAEPPSWARVVVVSTDSRDRDAETARAAVARAVTVLARRGPALWYKKVDSTLRGRLGLELAVTIQGVRPDLTILAPAFPVHGRTVIQGRGFLDGVPLERTQTWRHAGLRGPADLLSMLRADGLRVRGLPLHDIRSGRVGVSLRAAEGQVDVVVADAETEDDLAIVAAEGVRSGLKLLWSGSAGLSEHLARLCPGSTAGAPPDFAAPARPAAVVVGSAAKAAEAQIRHLEVRPDVRVVRIRPDVILADAAGRLPSGVATTELAGAERAIDAALADGQDVALGLVTSDAPGGIVLEPTDSRVLSSALGGLIGKYRDQVGGIVATGGDTALAVLGACGVTSLRPVSEVITGVPFSVASPDGRPVVTKAGAFGDERILARALDVLHGRTRPCPGQRHPETGR